jgi:hypothetical protein
MKVLIVSKTMMTAAVCVGGILEDGTYVRLLQLNGNNLPSNTKAEIGQVYEIEFTHRPHLTAPHVEDILVSNYKYIESVVVDYDLVQKLGATIWDGDINGLFDGMLDWTDSGSGFISRAKGLPENSVGFWRPNCNLTRNDYEGNVKFSCRTIRGFRNIKYVGVQEAPAIITAGTLLRVSLARWWTQPGTAEERCFLQLSGQY